MIYLFLACFAGLAVLTIVGAFLEILVLSLFPDGFFIKKQKYSIKVPGSENLKTGMGVIHRHAEAPNGPILCNRDTENVTTLYGMFREAKSRFGNLAAYGWRERPAVPKKDSGGPYQWATYTQFYERAQDFGAGLMQLGLLPKVDGMRLLAMYLKNCPEWVIAENGLYMYSGTTVPLYDTLGPDAARYILEHTGAPAALCGAALLGPLLRAAAPKLKSVVVVGAADPALAAAAQQKGLTLYTFEEVEAAGRAAGAGRAPHEPPRPGDPCTFCYTSGTTGNPKGALLSHSNMVAEITSSIMSGAGVTPGDRHLSYLPLAHVFERVILAVCFQGGGTAGFFSGDTRAVVDDLKALRPTVFISVPRLLNKVHDSIMDGARKKLVTRLLFGAALKAKGLKLRKVGRGRHAFWDRLVFNKVAAKVGLSECRMILSGSAPLAAHVLEFLRVAFPGISGIEGYGQTESTGAATLQAMYTTDAGNVGGPIVSCEIALQSVPDMGYLHTDAAHGEDRGTPCEGRGEICLRGHNVFMGYYKDEKKTKETIDADGWLHTGDIGIWLPNGALKIVDRKKNLFKLAQGEYVAPEKLENIYGKSSLVGQVFVYGDSLQASLVAVVVPDEQGLAAWAQAKGLAGDAAKLCALPELRADVLADILRVGKESKLHGFEIARAVHLDPEPFSMENGLITTTFKLKRDVAKKHYRLQIDAMYDSLAKK
mmetsp:Transcript_27469/g.43279  ORF Transcript_27469/g.43279 Transcript_27469/m.43279 type:complete len:709 (-) Transcript_27469:102-2228(-)